MMDRETLRNFVLSIVKPLMSGKMYDQDGDKATMDSLATGSFNQNRADNFKLTAPFGFISAAPRVVTGFYTSLFGSGHENIILAQLHKLRPRPSSFGEVIVYSTDSSGKEVKITVVLGADGKMVINCPADFVTNCVKALIKADQIELGKSGLEKAVLGETLMELYLSHKHIDSLGIQTTQPLPQNTDSALSNSVKVGS